MNLASTNLVSTSVASTDLALTKIVSTDIASPAKADPPFWSETAGRSLAILWRFLIGHARRQRKTLLVRETAALGDRRFVYVIQFEQRRFLIGSSPSSVTLLAELQAQPASDPEMDRDTNHTDKRQNAENLQENPGEND